MKAPAQKERFLCRIEGSTPLDRVGAFAIFTRPPLNTSGGVASELCGGTFLSDK